MFLRDKIEAAISAAQGNNKDAAVNVCVLLQQEMDLSGNGWFDGDEELVAVLKAQEAECDVGDDFLSRIRKTTTMFVRTDDFAVLNCNIAPASSAVNAPGTVPSREGRPAWSYFQGVVKEVNVDPFNEIVDLVRAQPSLLRGHPPGQIFGSFEVMKTLNPDDQITIVRESYGWQVLAGVVSEDTSLYVGSVTYEALREFSERSATPANCSR